MTTTTTIRYKEKEDLLSMQYDHQRCSLVRLLPLSPAVTSRFLVTEARGRNLHQRKPKPMPSNVTAEGLPRQDQIFREMPPHAVQYPSRSTEHKPTGWQWKRHRPDSLSETDCESQGTSRSDRDPSVTLLYPFGQSSECVSSSGGKRLGVEESDNDQDDLIVSDSDSEWNFGAEGGDNAEILKESESTEELPFRQQRCSPESNINAAAPKNDYIIWPPMIMVQNTILEIDECGKWIGMGNEELLELFKDYKVWSAKNAFGPRGHRGFALLRFDCSAVGYLEAERLHRHFIREGRGRAEWEAAGCRGRRIHSMGKRVLYGYFASKEDLDLFNKHSKGKWKQKYEIKSYQVMVAEAFKKMDEDNQVLLKLQRKDRQGQDTNKSLQETCRIMERNLCLAETEIKSIRKRDMEHHENAREKMDYLDRFYGKIINELAEELEKKEMVLEKMQDFSNRECLDRYVQLEAKLDTLMESTGLTEKEYQEKLAEIEEEITNQENETIMNFKCLEEYEEEKRLLWEEHCKKLKEVKHQNLEANMEMERMMEKERRKLLEKYAEKTKANYLC